MSKGIDTAARLTAAQAAELKAMGYEFVGRYLVPQTYAKALTKAEAEAICGAGLKLLTVWETTADRVKGGAAAGATDGARALACARALDMPADGIIYFAVDYDAQPAEMDAIEAYLRAARAQTEQYEIGVYGSYRVIEAMAQRGACKGFWQCCAWSYGQKSPALTVYQAQWCKYAAGATIDINDCPDMEAAGIWDYEEDNMKNTEEKYQVFRAFMERYEAERGALPEPEWSRKEGSWEKAKAAGVLDGARPEDPVKRDELAAVLSRMGLFS